jgi:hypothetical protein
MPRADAKTLQQNPETAPKRVATIHSPAGTHPVLARSKRLIQQRTIREHPAIKRDVIPLDAVLLYHVLELAVADGVRHLPADRP